MLAPKTPNAQPPKKITTLWNLWEEIVRQVISKTITQSALAPTTQYQ